MSRIKPVAELVSAGGVVYRGSRSGVEVAICRRSSPPVWGLPKGTPEEGETLEETALREVSEETGLQVRLERPIKSIEYWFVGFSDGVRCHKTVHFYLMSPTGGDISEHDDEFDEVRWFDAGEALKTLSYPSEVKILEKGLSMVSEKTGA